MKLIYKNSLAVKFVVSLFLLIFSFGCKKEVSPAMPEETLSKTQHPTKPSEESAVIVYGWYKFIAGLQLSLNPQPNVFVQNRGFSYIGIGLFESVQPGIKGGSSFGPKLYQMPAMPKPDMSKQYLWSASANAALASLFKLFLASLSVADRASIDARELMIYNQLKLSTPEAVMQRSEAFGRSIALAIYNWSVSDNFIPGPGNYTPLNEPWAYVTTPPNNPSPVGMNLQYSRPLLRYSLDAMAPPIPIAFSTIPGSAFYNAAMEVHDLGGTLTATAANKATANWWADAGGPGTGIPAPYHLLSIITAVLESSNSGLWKAAEVYAKAGIAMKDGPIIVFRSKYYYNLLRPITYIRRHIDPTWFSHLLNPPYPDYSSGLVGFYGSVMEVLINEFGDIPVTDNAYAWRNLPPRHFASLSDLRMEAALSRVYAGIHYRFTQLVSIDMGIKLGDEIDQIRVVGPEYE